MGGFRGVSLRCVFRYGVTVIFRVFVFFVLCSIVFGGVVCRIGYFVGESMVLR